MLIGGYGVARRVAALPLVLVALAASLTQSAVAVLLFLGGVWLLGWGRTQLEWANATYVVPFGSLMIAGVGLWMLVRGTRKVLAVPGGTTIEVPAGGVTGLAGPGVTVGVTGITDQRCPSAVDCVWEGMTRVVPKLEDGQATVVLCNLCDDGDRPARLRAIC